MRGRLWVEFSLIVSIESAFESVVAHGVDGVRLIFGVYEARAVVDMVDFGCVCFMLEAPVLVEVMVRCFSCFLG